MRQSQEACLLVGLGMPRCPTKRAGQQFVKFFPFQVAQYVYPNGVVLLKNYKANGNVFLCVCVCVTDVPMTV